MKDTTVDDEKNYSIAIDLATIKAIADYSDMDWNCMNPDRKASAFVLFNGSLVRLERALGVDTFCVHEFEKRKAEREEWLRRPLSELEKEPSLTKDEIELIKERGRSLGMKIHLNNLLGRWEGVRLTVSIIQNVNLTSYGKTN